MKLQHKKCVSHCVGDEVQALDDEVSTTKTVRHCVGDEVQAVSDEEMAQSLLTYK